MPSCQVLPFLLLILCPSPARPPLSLLPLKCLQQPRPPTTPLCTAPSTPPRPHLTQPRTLRALWLLPFPCCFCPPAPQTLPHAPRPPNPCPHPARPLSSRLTWTPPASPPAHQLPHTHASTPLLLLKAPRASAPQSRLTTSGPQAGRAALAPGPLHLLLSLPRTRHLSPPHLSPRPALAAASPGSRPCGLHPWGQAPHGSPRPL